jgi:hypothetical protein
MVEFDHRVGVDASEVTRFGSGLHDARGVNHQIAAFD